MYTKFGLRRTTMFYFNHDGLEELIDETLSDVKYPNVNKGLGFAHLEFCWKQAMEEISNLCMDYLDYEELEHVESLANQVFGRFGYPVFNNLEHDNIFFVCYYTIFYCLAQVKAILQENVSCQERLEVINYTLDEAIYRFTINLRWKTNIALTNLITVSNTMGYVMESDIEYNAVAL